MSVTNTPRINLRGDARQALEFYHSGFGGQVMIATYGQFGVPKTALPTARTHNTGGQRSHFAPRIGH
jgi:PhnB protein